MDSRPGTLPRWPAPLWTSVTHLLGHYLQGSFRAPWATSMDTMSSHLVACKQTKGRSFLHEPQRPLNDFQFKAVRISVSLSDGLVTERQVA